MILLLFLGQELHDPESLVRTGANSAAHGDGREKSCPVVFLKPLTCIRFLLEDVQMSVFQGSWTNFSRKISSCFFFFKSEGDFISVQDLKFCYSGKSNRHSLIKSLKPRHFFRAGVPSRKN